MAGAVNTAARGTRVAETGQVGAFVQESNTLTREYLQGRPSDDDLETRRDQYEVRRRVNAHQQMLDDRDQDEAAANNMDLDNWLQIPEDVRHRIMSSRGRRGADNHISYSANLGKDPLGTTRQSSAGSEERLTSLARTLTSNERKHYLYMCPKPVLAPENPVTGEAEHWFTPEPRLVPRVDMEDKWDKEWTDYPKFDFLPEPDKPCPMNYELLTGIAGQRCPYIGRSDDEVDVHMLYTHPQEYQTRLRVQAQQRADQEREERRAALEEQRAQTAALIALAERNIPVPADLAPATGGKKGA